MQKRFAVQDGGKGAQFSYGLCMVFVWQTYGFRPYIFTLEFKQPIGCKWDREQTDGALGAATLVAPAPWGRFGRGHICFGQI